MIKRKTLLILLCITILASCCSCYTKSPNRKNKFQKKRKHLYSIDSNETLPTLSHGILNSNESVKNDKKLLYLDNGTLPNIKYDLFLNNKLINAYVSNENISFPKKYSTMDGILTFRGDNLRNSPSFGTCNIKEKKLQEKWHFNTHSSTWGGGAGWTGQPAIVKWPKDILKIMNIKDKFKIKDNFIEVIYASLDGHIYFIDLETGEETRNPINISNPIKGSVSIDPRGYPLLYVGQGIPEKGAIGYRIFNLIDSSLLYFIDGRDSLALRNWGAFDSSPLINRNNDSLILCGENGLFYNIKLNTNFNMAHKKISIKPEVIKYRYTTKKIPEQGMENSPAVYKNLVYFGDNSGNIQCINLQNMKPLWTFDNTDDTDATITIEEENGTPCIYTANEVDKQGAKGICNLRKLDGLTGKVIFEKSFEAMSLLGKSPVNGGALATNIIGKNDIENLVIFNIARYKNFNGGILLALDKKTGKEVWKLEMNNYCWSSPTAVYDSKGKSYIVQGDSAGNLFLIEGITGKVLHSIKLGSNIESSPAIYENTIILATRWGKFFAITIK
ncbi:PQQ-binding-like beta-propeller repeat protein [Haloimpatiens massiliensis]|uniref:outer membrane protein assembly factor BamB family protein n=1 Tax=Haloimpatiens massiliensis TaxID=1658110 RepID=UPI000C85BAC6|nr:PQQ-binding-like beta-propeller repeat protein [Haloimpatiens massiliensis]